MTPKLGRGRMGSCKVVMLPFRGAGWRVCCDVFCAVLAAGLWGQGPATAPPRGREYYTRGARHGGGGGGDPSVLDANYPPN